MTLGYRTIWLVDLSKRFIPKGADAFVLGSRCTDATGEAAQQASQLIRSVPHRASDVVCGQGCRGSERCSLRPIYKGMLE